MTQFAAISSAGDGDARSIRGASAAPAAASPGRGARPARRRRAAASTGSGGSGSPTRPRASAAWKYSGKRPQRTYAAAPIAPCDLAVGVTSCGLPAAEAPASRLHGPGVLAGEQPAGRIVGVGAPAPAPARRRPARAPGRRRSAAATERKMPIGTCAMLGSSRRESANACDGSSASTRRGCTMRAGSGLGASARPASYPRSSRTTTCRRRRAATGSPSVEVEQPGLRLVAVLEHVEGAVVEDRAVLVDLDERRAAVLGGRPQHR